MQTTPTHLLVKSVPSIVKVFEIGFGMSASTQYLWMIKIHSAYVIVLSGCLICAHYNYADHGDMPIPATSEKYSKHCESIRDLLSACQRLHIMYGSLKLIEDM